MPEAPYYAEAFSPLPGRCFRMVAHHGEAGPAHCPEPVTWRGSWRAPSGRRYRIEACEGHRPAPDKAAARLPSVEAVVPTGAQVQVHPAALPLDLVDLAFAVVLTFPRGSLAVVDCCLAWGSSAFTTGSSG